MRKNNLNLRLLLLVIFTLVGITQGDAVFKERDFGKTIDVLCAELELKYNKQKELMAKYEGNAKAQHQRLVATMQQIDQISLVLYSQSSEFSFAMAYACQQATDLYHNSMVAHMPFDRIMNRLDAEIERYDSLIYVLKHISPAISDEDEVQEQPKGKTASRNKATQQPAVIENNDSVSTVEDIADSIMQSAEATHKNSVPLDGSENDHPKMTIPGNGQNEKDLLALYVLNDKEKDLRERCLIYAKALRNNFVRIKNKMSADKEYYDEVKNKLKSLNNYALKKYEELQNSIFRNGGNNYFAVLASMGRNTYRIQEEMNDKYSELKHVGDQHRVKSQWRGPVIVMTSVFILFYIFIATILSVIILIWCLPKKIRRNSIYQSKKAVIGLACGVFLFTVFITIAKSVVKHNFINMAVGITLNFSWLLLVILVSLLIRLNGKQIKSGVMVYTPFMLMAFVVIVFRIVFIPNNLVNLIFPPLLLAFTIWQFFVFKNRKAELPMSDVIFSFISLMTMIVACVLAWVGYTLLAVQIMVWWSFQLACIQTIICIYDLAKIYEEKFLVRRIKKDSLLNERSKGRKKKQMSDEKMKTKLLEQAKKGEHIGNTWFFDLLIKVVVPVLAVLSVLMSIRFAANMFDMNELLKKAFFYNFIDQEGLVQISLYKIVLVSALFFVFYYLNYVIHSVYRQYKLKQYAKTSPSRRPNITLANNIITILVWGSFFIFALVLFKVPKSGISLISAGLATGLGFAMKDILENFIYGLSLMSGRLRVGDYIECEGILGKVESIGYQSTQIVTLDGSIIAFLNAQLFGKNFKNMTKNHSYEYVKLPVGVAYGVDVENVRTILVEELNSKLSSLTSQSGRPVIQKKQGFNVFFNNFGDSSVDLLVAFWVLVEERISFTYKVKEIIYNTLRQNNIEIPFPQRDVYIRQMNAPEKPKNKNNKN